MLGQQFWAIAKFEKKKIDNNPAEIALLQTFFILYIPLLLALFIEILSVNLGNIIRQLI